MGQISLPIFLALLQIIFIVLFGLFVRYPPDQTVREKVIDKVYLSNRSIHDNNTNTTQHHFYYRVLLQDEARSDVVSYYAGFQHISAMLFVGFGFLMTFLKRYGYSSITFNLVLSALSIQWAILTQGLIINFTNYTIILSITSLIKAEFAAMAVLVSFGAVLGKLNLLQLSVMALIEVVLFQCNQLVCFGIFKSTDTGYSMMVHMFGAYFGLMVALFTARPGDVQAQSYKELSVYHSDLFTMIGTVFLFLFYPSLNAALCPNHAFLRAVTNTYLALLSSALVVVVVSSLVQKNKRLTMIHIQNATLAGGVAMGTMADLIMCPWAAMVVGVVAGGVSVIGYQFLTPCCNQRLKIHDTRGIHNLHGLPGLISAIGAVVCVAVATSNSGEMPSTPALYQLASVGVILGIALVGGILTGLLLRLPIWRQPKDAEIMDDWDYWVLPSDGYPVIPNSVNAPPIYKLPEETSMMIST